MFLKKKKICDCNLTYDSSILYSKGDAMTKWYKNGAEIDLRDPLQ